ncbi:MAG TPA: hypothetical protein VF898_03340, partial [Chloroflexota bacterium]
MIQSGRRVQSSALATRLVARAGLTARLVLAELLVGSPVLTRVGFVVLAVLLQTIALFSPGHFRPADTPFFAVLVPAATLGAIGFLICAAVPFNRLNWLRVRQGVAGAGLVALLTLSVVGVFHAIPAVGSMAQDNPPSNDGAVMDYYAARQVLHGHNPYAKTNIVA